MRVLYKILLLNLWHSLKRSRYMMPTFVVAAGILLAGGGYLAIQGVQMAEQRLSSASNARSGDSSARSNSSFGVPKQSSLSNDAGSTTNNKKPDASTGQKPNQSAGGQQSDDDLKVTSIALDPPVSACIQGQRMYQVSSAALALAGDATAGKSVKWYWETRIDGGLSPDKESILSGDIHTTGLADGSQSVVLTAAVDGDPLISTAANNTYAYSFRLHIVGPNDITSDWVAVPLLDESTSCPG